MSQQRSPHADDRRTTRDDGAGPRHVVRPRGYHRIGTNPPRWCDSDGVPVTDTATLARLAALAIPPAWTHVWASAEPSADVQATGIDARGRTQYRYSAAAIERAAADKFAHLLDFAAALPALRAVVADDLASDAAPGDAHPHPRRAIAATVRLLDLGLFRVGSDRYARDNHTYGLTTLRRDQVELDGTRMAFDFVGKEHLRHRIVLDDAAAASALGDLLDQPGDAAEHVFAIADPPVWRRIDSPSVNAYLHAHGGAVATAKVFRTWGATVAAAAVAAGASVDAPLPRRRDPAAVAFDAAALVLGDTPAVARASYVHPRAVEVGRHASVIAAVRAAADNAGTDEFRAVFHEAGVQATVLAGLVERAG